MSVGGDDDHYHDDDDDGDGGGGGGGGGVGEMFSFFYTPKHLKLQPCGAVCT